MTKILGIVLIVYLSLSSCKSRDRFSAFDSFLTIQTNFRVQDSTVLRVDTNRYDNVLLRSLFSKIKANDVSDLLIVRNLEDSLHLQAVGAYNFANRKFYYSLSHGKQYYFTDLNTPQSEGLFKMISPLVAGSTLERDDAIVFVTDNRGWVVDLLSVDLKDKSARIKTFKWN